MWRFAGLWSAIRGVIGCFSSSVLSPSTTPFESSADDASKTGRSSRWKRRSTTTSRSLTWGCSQARFSRKPTSASRSGSSALSRAADDSAYRRKSTKKVYGAAPAGLPKRPSAGLVDRLHGPDPVDGELPHVVGPVVAGGEPATVDAHRIDQPLGRRPVVVDVVDQHGPTGLDGLAECGERAHRRQCPRRRGGEPRLVGPVAGPDCRDDLGQARLEPCVGSTTCHPRPRSPPVGTADV